MQGMTHWMADNYGFVIPIAIGVFFCIIGYQEWFQNLPGREFPKPVTRTATAILFGLLWPISATYYAIFFATEIAKCVVEWCSSKDNAKPSKPRVRCYKCNTLIDTVDSFCRVCGADQANQL